jgi:hypothetical protein
MLHRVKDLQGCDILATDGGIGSVETLYFDDARWTIRYLVVDTGKWLPGKLVLVSPIAIRQPNWTNRTLAVALTRDQVRNSPDIDTHKPVSRQQEVAYARYYRYPYYWSGPGLWGAWPSPALIPPHEMAELDRYAEAEQERAKAQGDDHLRSTKEVIGYRLHASDGELGHVDDFLIDDDTWAIRYLVIDTSNWWSGKRVLVSPEMIQEISWSGHHVSVDLTRDRVKAGPEFDAAAHVDRQWEVDYYRHYNRAPYWARPDVGRATGSEAAATVASPPRGRSERNRGRSREP